MCRSMVDIQSPTAEIRRKKEERKKKKQDENIYMVSLFHRATINKLNMQNPLTIGHMYVI